MKSLSDFLKNNNIHYTDPMIGQLEDYMKGLLDWNKKVNLTSITDPEEFVLKHYIDSIACMITDQFKSSRKCIDVGTGGGFPGIPLAVLNPDKEFVLMDSLRKRLNIIDRLCQDCGISNVHTLHMRAEDAGKNKNLRESFDICLSRAVANMATLSELCLPLVKKGGSFIAYKSLAAAEEIQAASKAIRMMGGKVPVQLLDLSDVLSDNHQFVIILKQNSTPSKYPRKAGTPGKEPIL